MTTQNEQPDPTQPEPTQPGPAKNRWTRWYMWAAYATAALVVGIIIAANTSSGDSATATPAEPVASAAANQTADQTKEDAKRHEEQTKTAEKQAEEMEEQQAQEAQDALRAEYCEDLSTTLFNIHELVGNVTLFAVASQSGVTSTEIFENLRNSLGLINVGGAVIKNLIAPEDAKKVHRRAEDLADDLMKKTDDIGDNFNDFREYSRGEGLPITEHSTAFYIDQLISSSWEMSKVFESGADKIVETDYCPSLDSLHSER